jgi:hypothetical protein
MDGVGAADADASRLPAGFLEQITKDAPTLRLTLPNGRLVVGKIERLQRVAGAVASALGASRLFLLTDVAGVLDKSGQLLTDLDPAAIAKLQSDGTISGGMIPKIQTCVDAVESGVDAAVILDGRTSHAMLIEMFTVKGAGTLIHK